MSASSLYDVLGVDKTASADDIKKAYRKLSLLNHPDRNQGSAAATESFQKLSQAYHTLGDEDRRRQHDLQEMLQQQQQQAHPSSSPFRAFNMSQHPMSQMFGGNMPFGMGPNMANGPTMFTTNIDMDPSDILNFFSQMGMGGVMGMGGGPGGGGVMEGFKASLAKPPPIIKTEEIPLSKAFVGCTVPLEVTRWVAEQNVRREETETLYVTIPPGVDHNEIIILREKGNIMRETLKGDVKVFIKVINDTDFVRTGLDLTLQKTISLKEALCGFNFDMKYIDGRIFKINNGVGNVVTHNYSKVLQGMGLKRGEHSGNLIIQFTVTFPEKLTPEQVEALRLAL
jgi:DnaJ-class molecular chaperone